MISFSRICVYCGSSPGLLPAYRDAAIELGRTLAGQGIGVVYGGATAGLMGAVADAAKINHETEGFVKILADANTDRILGVHMIGPSVGQLIGEYCVVAMEFSASVEDIALTCHPHLTRSEAGRQTAMGVHGWTMQA